MHDDRSRYGGSLALLTDLYQLTMAFGYWKARVHDHEATFHLSYRRNPFGGGFVLACGLADVLELLADLRFSEDDVAYLGTLTGADGGPLFERDFLAYLRALRFEVDIDALPEGTVAFPHEPLLRVSGPIIACQILETALLNIMNFQSLIATKAARVALAARGEPVLEFGLRRAQGIDGGLAASRASYVGGCDATSNVLAGKLFGIPVRGTHAHSWVMFFGDELEAFERYAEAMPNNCVLLVDTYDTLEGVRHAISIGRALRARGHDLLGIRLDSGDLAELSSQARKLLDAAGFHKTAVVASSDLDEHAIEELRGRGARIGVWGVGTRLATGWDQPALGGVYKLSSLRRPGGAWEDRIKLSNEPAKTSLPGTLQVRRLQTGDGYVADVIHDVRDAAGGAARELVALGADGARLTLPEATSSTDLLLPVVRGGRAVYEAPSATAAREHARGELGRLPEGVKRLKQPALYPVGLEAGLYERRRALIASARGEAP